MTNTLERTVNWRIPLKGKKVEGALLVTFNEDDGTVVATVEDALNSASVRLGTITLAPKL